MDLMTDLLIHVETLYESRIDTVLMGRSCALESGATRGSISYDENIRKYYHLVNY